MANKSGVPTSMRRRVFREEKYTCAKCSITGEERAFPRGGYGYPTSVPGVFLSIDHIVPRAKGGTGDRKNLRVLCTPCNTEKGTKDA